jgi:hypothetical protein
MPEEMKEREDGRQKKRKKGNILKKRHLRKNKFKKMNGR